MSRCFAIKGVLHLFQCGCQFTGGCITLLKVGLASFQDHIIQAHELGWISLFEQCCRQCGKNGWRASREEDIKDHAQAEDVCTGGARGLWWRWHIARCAYPALVLSHQPNLSDQAHIGQLGLPLYKHNVLRLDVAMSQSLPMQVIQRTSQLEADLYAFLWWQPQTFGLCTDSSQITRNVT